MESMVKRLGLMCLSFGLVACGSGSDGGSGGGTNVTSPEQQYHGVMSYEGMTKVWSDEFDGDSIDTTRWAYDVGDGCPALCGWGNNELQYYTSSTDNAYIAGGNLVIRAKREAISSANYSSAKLVTRGKQVFQYGRIDVRAKMPTGRGIWPAIWLLPADNVYGGWPASGEIDIVELVGQEPEKIHGTVHFGPQVGTSQSLGDSYSLSSGKFADGFHLFSIVWSEDKIRWLVDNVEYHAISKTDLGSNTYPFNESFYLIMNVAVGGNWPGSPNATTTFPQTMVVDYVRVFQ